MKYRVSLLPEQNRKRLNGKRKLEKIKLFSLVTLIVLAIFTFVVMFTSLYADKKLAEAKKLDNEYAQKVAELEQFREINATLQEKVKLIESIQIEEPQLVNFVAKIANLKTPGVSISSIECKDWKVTRQCTLLGECDTREQYLNFEKKLQKLKGVSAVVCTEYKQGVGDGAVVSFTVNLTCIGGIVATEAPTEAVTGDATGTTTAATSDTTVAATE